MLDPSSPLDPSRETSAEPVTVFSAKNQEGIPYVLRDLLQGLRQQEVWRAFAWDEIQQRFQGSVLGIAWIAVSYIVFVLAIGFFFGGFAKIGADGFVVYVAFGFAAFTFFTGSLTDGCTVFRSSASWIKSAPLPVSIHIYKSVSRSIFTFAIQLASGVALVALFFGWVPTYHAFLAIPAIALVMVNGLFLQYTLGLTAARWGDILHLIATIQRFLFFTTPILWVYDEREGMVQRVADLNPLTHYIEIFRAPLVGRFPNMHSVLLVLAL